MRKSVRVARLRAGSASRAVRNGRDATAPSLRHLNPIGLTKEQIVSDFRRASILDAARQLFHAKSYEKITAAEIAGAARIAKGTLYLYYRSKSDIFWAILVHELERLYTETAQRLEKSESVAEKLRVYLSAHVKWCEANRDLLAILHSDFGRILDSESRLAKLNREHFDLIEQALKQGVEDGTLRPINVLSVAKTIYFLPMALFRSRAITRIDVTEEDIEAAIDLISWGINSARDSREKAPVV